MNRLALALLLFASACTTSGPAGNGERFDWRCARGAAFSVRFTGQGAGQIAHVFAGGQLYHLPAAMSASGARYAKDNVEYWEHQGEAMLNGAAGGPYTECHQH